MSSFLLKLAGGEKAIDEGEEALQNIDKALSEVEAKVDPFLAKVSPFLSEVIEEALKASPKLSAVVTPTEIAEFATAVSAIPALLKEGHAFIAAAEAKLKSL
jgi:hypothetical protein